MPIKAIVDGVEKEITRIPVLANSAYKDAWEVRDNQDRLLWYREDTLTGVSPISFRGYGIPLKSVKIDGNTQQTGTPAPDAPIMPELVGERTGNLAPPMDIWLDGYVNASGQISAQSATRLEKTSPLIQVDDSLTYSYSYRSDSGYFPAGDENVAWRAIACYDTDGVFLTRIGGNGRHPIITTGENALPTGAAFVRLTLRTYGNNTNCMLNSGSTPLPYEPYGYKLPITCAGQTVPIYLGQTQTVRRVKKLVLDGTESTWQKFNNLNLFRLPDTSKDYRMQDDGAICDSLPLVSRGDLTANTFCWSTGTIGELIININNYNLADLKTYLNSNPITIWYVLAESETGIVNEPLCKIGDYADELTTDPNITPQTGTNTLTVDTTLSPSSVSITGHVKEVAT